jgi:DNA-binding NtrC family response regulator
MSEKVLIVDDDADFLEILSERMRARGMVVATASTAKEAIDILEQQTFDAVLLDLQMPYMDGIEALKIMKSKKPETQVILLTGHASVPKGVEAIRIGAMDFISKPADINELTQKIRQAQHTRMVLVEKKTQEKIKKIISDKGW